MPGFTYKSYSFIDKDPVIDFVRTVVNESGKTLKDIGYESGVHPHTISKWLYGDTKQPKHASVNAVLRALGYKLEVVTYNFKRVVQPTTLIKKNVVRLPVRKKRA